MSVLVNHLIQSKFSNERRKNQNRSITTTNHNTGSDTGNLTDARENASWFSCHIWLFEMVLRIFSGQPQSVVSKTKAIQDHFWYSTENCSTKKNKRFHWLYLSSLCDCFENLITSRIIRLLMNKNQALGSNAFLPFSKFSFLLWFSLASWNVSFLLESTTLVTLMWGFSTLHQNSPLKHYSCRANYSLSRAKLRSHEGWSLKSLDLVQITSGHWENSS